MKRLVFLWLVSLLGSIGAYSQEDASYPWQVKGDSLLLFEGTTYRYTVDTPEDSGLVSTLIKVEDLKKQLKENGLGRFSLFSSNGREKMHGYPETGDYLLAASPGKRFAVKVHKGALPPRLCLNREVMTVPGKSSLLVDFYAGQRSPDVTVTFHIPAGIDLTLDNTTVNLIRIGKWEQWNLWMKGITENG